MGINKSSRRGSSQRGDCISPNEKADAPTIAERGVTDACHAEHGADASAMHVRAKKAKHVEKADASAFQK